MKKLKIINPLYIITSDNNFTILKDKAILFNEKILQIDTLQNLQKKYPNATFVKSKKNSILMPGLINAHTHLEFSSNKTTLKYGNFIKWLYSVIENRDELLSKKTNIKQTISNMVKTGTTCIGAISSYAIDLPDIIDSKIRCVYFNEVIGSVANNIDMLFNDFKDRFFEAKKLENDLFTSSIAIHSAYSVHPILLKHIINFAKENDSIISAHFLESLAELEWLENSKGEFYDFFKSFFNTTSSINSIDDFLKQISSSKHILLTHNCYLRKKEKEYIFKKDNIYITHCPTSNRLLGSKRADIDFLLQKNANIATDGLSSNTSLSMFDEMRNALFVHDDCEIHSLAKQLILFATKNASNALNINSGCIETGRLADFIVLDLFQENSQDNIESLALNVILHTKEVEKTFINGELYFEKK